MKLEVGMYVRIKNRGIAKFRGWNAYDENKVAIHTHNEGDIEITPVIDKNTIIKASHNIIDLIEVGDYLNGFIVNEIERDNTNTIIKIGNSTFNVLENEEIYTPSNDKNNGYEKIEKLKSIVTHEQMEQIAYKVEE